MNGQITPEHIETLLALNGLILVVVAMRLVGLAAWRRWFADDAAADEAAYRTLTQEERDERLVTRRRRQR